MSCTRNKSRSEPSPARKKYIQIGARGKKWRRREAGAANILVESYPLAFFLFTCFGRGSLLPCQLWHKMRRASFLLRLRGFGVGGWEESARELSCEFACFFPPSSAIPGGGMLIVLYLLFFALPCGSVFPPLYIFPLPWIIPISHSNCFQSKLVHRCCIAHAYHAY